MSHGCFLTYHKITFRTTGVLFCKCLWRENAPRRMTLFPQFLVLPDPPPPVIDDNLDSIQKISCKTHRFAFCRHFLNIFLLWKIEKRPLLKIVKDTPRIETEKNYWTSRYHFIIRSRGCRYIFKYPALLHSHLFIISILYNLAHVAEDPITIFI